MPNFVPVKTNNCINEPSILQGILWMKGKLRHVVKETDLTVKGAEAEKLLE